MTKDDLAAGNGAATYQVLARKYRPQRFDDLIGHEAMVRTLRNSFATGRIAHAYVLTGVRGVGKTTTARILARALNYVGPEGEDVGPVIDMPAEGRHCRAIAESRHPDVMEMDAASRTGVGDIRELIEGVRYAPLQARYKVYIIDEVHMLSTAAFNALLKTLEEPPPHVKFIFATTEIRKLPVTVLSRCQRFDLRRIAPDVLVGHLGQIAALEGVAVEPEGLAMIARAAEGSVRDALSLLDQALVQNHAAAAKTVSAVIIRDMLGLADRGQVWELLESSLKGNAPAALAGFRRQYDAGADPAVILRDLLDVVHLLTRVKAAGREAANHGAAGEAESASAAELSARLPMNALTRAWSLLMRGLTETLSAPDPAAAAEMALIRILYAADLPTPDEALRLLKAETVPAANVAAPSGDNIATSTRGPSFRSEAPQPPPLGAAVPVSRKHASVGANGSTRASVQAPAPAPQTIDLAMPRLHSLADIVQLAAERRDIKLKIELESYVHLISFEAPRIEIRLAEKAPPDLSGRLLQRLKEWTGVQWSVIVSTAGEGRPTIRDARYAEVMNHPSVQAVLATFPKAEVVAIRDVAYNRAPELIEAAIPEDPDAESE